MKIPPVEEITGALPTDSRLRLSVYRLDQVHPVISGNKWYKLKGYLEQAITQGADRIVTFGGAYSNHIVATACACQLSDIGSTGIIRGEKPAKLSHTLRAAMDFGMQLHFVSREAYRAHQIPPDLETEGKPYYLVPEGGYGERGAAGFATAMEQIDLKPFSHFICAVGTGTMMAGMIRSAGNKPVTGINVVRNEPVAQEAVERLIGESVKCPFRLVHDYHFGGYARHQESLFRFMNEWFQKTGIPTDFVYTAKMFYGLNDLAEKGYFSRGSHLLAVHSGGLQGNASLPRGILHF